MRHLSFVICHLLLLTVFTSSVYAADTSVTVDAATETVLRGSVKYLAAKQNANGSWAADGRAVAMTGYTLLAFLATGNLPNEGPHGKTVAAGVQYLLDAVNPDGMYTPSHDGQYMYGHGIATIALAEVYGQTKLEKIRPKLEKVVKLIVNGQNRTGGWRYRPTSHDADISVTVLQVVALRAAKNAGLDVPDATISNAVGFVRSCYHEPSGGFTYEPRNQAPGFARTAAAIYSLQVCGAYDDPRVKTGSAYLFKRLDDRQWFTYGHFYAAPAQYMVGGEAWQDWYGRMNELLLKNVKRDGDQAWWNPDLDHDSRNLGPLYATAVYTTILAMPYHYIPLYQR